MKHFKSSTIIYANYCDLRIIGNFKEFKTEKVNGRLQIWGRYYKLSNIELHWVLLQDYSNENLGNYIYNLLKKARKNKEKRFYLPFNWEYYDLFENEYVGVDVYEYLTKNWFEENDL